MPVNLQDAPEQREFGGVIPDGTFVNVELAMRPQGVSLQSGDAEQDALDDGLFYQSQTSDAILIDSEMTVIEGQWKNQKIWQYFTIAGGNLNPDGTSKGAAISNAAFRAMINSATGLDPKDQSPSARQMRTMRGYKDLDNITFWCRVGIQAGDDAPNGGKYPDKNTIAHIVEPGEPEYQLLTQGHEVPPQPRGARGGSTGGGTARQDASKPAWQRDAAPASAPAKAAPSKAAGPAWANGGNPTQASASTATSQANGGHSGGQTAEAGAPSAQAGPGQTAPATASPSSGPAWLRK